MPLLTFDLIEGRTEQEVKTLLDAAHRFSEPGNPHQDDMTAVIIKL